MIRTRVRFYATFREIVGGREVELELPDGARVRELLDVLFARWPTLREYLVAPDGGFSKRANLFLDGRAIRFLPDGVETPIGATQEIDCFPAVAGG
ncbi:MAG: ubiquitin-like small modifier protein 1 [Myxococcota bacterium]